jgi:hypothetical protein
MKVKFNFIFFGGYFKTCGIINLLIFNLICKNGPTRILVTITSHFAQIQMSLKSWVAEIPKKEIVPSYILTTTHQKEVVNLQ